MFLKRLILTVVMLDSLFTLSGPGGKTEAPPADADILETMIVSYAAYGERAEAQNAGRLEALRALDPVSADKWGTIMDLWKTTEQNLEIHAGALPDGLPDTEELCLVVLGYELNLDGSMRSELLGRLRVALAAASKYPRARIVCTGGGTALLDETATEAGRMAQWLVENGVESGRILAEDRSLTTAQNAIYTLRLLTEEAPQARRLAIISSDYHIATATLFFSAGAELLAQEGEEPFTVVSNAALPVRPGGLSRMFQAAGLLELAGDEDTAYEIYDGTYELQRLPALVP